MSPPSESSRSFISESCHMCSVQNLLNSFPLFVASRPQTLMQWWVNHLHLSLSSGEGLVSQKETSASPEIIPCSTLGLGLIWCVGQDHVKERIFVTSSGILGCDRPTAIPRSIQSASACWVWLMPPVTLSWPWRPRKCFPMLDQDMAHFSQEESPNMAVRQSLVWWPQPRIHTGWTGLAVPRVFLAVDLYYNLNTLLRHRIKILVFSRIHWSVCTE